MYLKLHPLRGVSGHYHLVPSDAANRGIADPLPTRSAHVEEVAVQIAAISSCDGLIGLADGHDDRIFKLSGIDDYPVAARRQDEAKNRRYQPNPEHLVHMSDIRSSAKSQSLPLWTDIVVASGAEC